MSTCEGSGPSMVGEQATFTVTFTPPSFAPGLIASAVTATVTKPDGTTTDDTAGLTELDDNFWSYVQTGSIDAAGYWTWTVKANAGFVAIARRRVKIAR